MELNSVGNSVGNYLKCAPKKFENPAKLFDPSENAVGTGADGHVSDMCYPSVMPSVIDVGNGADGHVSDMRDPSVMPSVIDVGNTVGIRADGHVSDMRATIRRYLMSEKPSKIRR